MRLEETSVTANPPKLDLNVFRKSECALELCASCFPFFFRIYFHVFRELFRAKFAEGSTKNLDDETRATEASLNGLVNSAFSGACSSSAKMSVGERQSAFLSTAVRCQSHCNVLENSLQDKVHARASNVSHRKALWRCRVEHKRLGPPRLDWLMRLGKKLIFGTGANRGELSRAFGSMMFQ